MTEKIHFLTCHPGARVPTVAYPGDAGHDLYACEQVEIPPRGSADVRTGIKMALPAGYWARICARSSSYRKRGALVLDGVIDAGFRGELFALTLNMTDSPLLVGQGERIAQVIIHQVQPLRWERVLSLPPSERGESGFGSSGS